MLSFTDWLGGGGESLPAGTEAVRAAAAWRRINHKPTSVAFRGAGGITRGAQLVRLEFDDTASQAVSVAGAGATMKLIIFGVRNHPTIPDTIMIEGDRFNYAGDAYRVVDVILTIGEIQGIAEATG